MTQDNHHASNGRMGKAGQRRALNRPLGFVSNGETGGRILSRVAEFSGSAASEKGCWQCWRALHRDAPNAVLCSLRAGLEASTISLRSDYLIPRGFSNTDPIPETFVGGGVRADGHPDGAIVEAGEHAIDILGYSSLNDPFSVKPQQLNGFYIFDPWFGRGNSGMPNWPYNGFAPNSYVAIATWNSTYYKPDTTDGAFWNNTYDGVLRSSSGSPSDSPAQSYGDYVYNQTVGAAAPPLTSANEAASPPTSSIAMAVSNGLAANSLETGGELGIGLTGYAMGPSVHVTSLATGIPSYDLVELVVGTSPKAVALVEESPGGFAFGAITPVAEEPLIMTSSGRQSSLSANGMSGPGTLVWAPSTAGDTPFAPFLEGTGSATGQRAYLSMTGRVSTIEIAAGLIAASQ